MFPESRLVFLIDKTNVEEVVGNEKKKRDLNLSELFDQLFVSIEKVPSLLKCILKHFKCKDSRTADVIEVLLERLKMLLQMPKMKVCWQSFLHFAKSIVAMHFLSEEGVFELCKLVLVGMRDCDVVKDSIEGSFVKGLKYPRILATLRSY